MTVFYVISFNVLLKIYMSCSGKKFGGINHNNIQNHLNVKKVKCMPP
jgi:hypothetical protein